MTTEDRRPADRFCSIFLISRLVWVASRAAVSIIWAHFLWVPVQFRFLQEIGSLQNGLKRVAEIMGQNAQMFDDIRRCFA